MTIRLPAYLLGAVLLLMGCAATPKETLPDSSAAVLTANDEQVLLGKSRAEAIYSRWSADAKAVFLKRPESLLAVRTLNLTPEQAASLGTKIPSPESAICVVIWDAKTRKMVGTDCHVAVVVPPLGRPVRFGPSTAQYVGSL